MTTSKRGLGRGLDALLSANTMAPQSLHTTSINQVSNHNQLQYLALTQLSRGQYQPRQKMSIDALNELADSIREQGVIQPLVVRPLNQEQYEIVAGERRFRAAKIAGLTHVPCLIKQLDDQTTGAIALIENIQREDLNVMEEAEALQRLVRDFSLTHQQLANVLGQSRASISNLLRLNGLTGEIKQCLIEGQLEMGHARALLALEGQVQIDTGQQVIQKHLTVRQTEALVKKLQSIETPKNQKNAAHFSELQSRLSHKLQTKVMLFQGNGESGKLVIQFDQNEKLMQILSIFDEKI